MLLLVPEAFGPLRALGTRFHASAQGSAVLERVERILEPPSTPRPAGTAGPGEVTEIRLADVTVTFPGRDRPVLDHVSLTIRRSETEALIGPSGAGKSTLLHVLLGLVTPDSGRVLINGVDLRQIDLDGWRRCLAWLPQNPHLFAGTVADNIRLGDPGASDRAVETAARAAHAWQFVNDGTTLTDGGTGLSAGQRQRVAVARALLLDAPITLLDEPTARLDMNAENDLVDAVGRLLHGRTALLVAHRPAILDLADRVLRVENGRIHDCLEVLA